MELFVLHAPGDAAWVRGYLLPELGLPDGAVGILADFRPGAPLADELERAVAGARVVLLVLTPAFLDDTWSKLGEQLASHAAVGGPEGRLVPLVLEPCRLPLRVGFRVQLDCTSPQRWAEAVGRLRRHLDRPGRRRRPSGSSAPTRGWWPSARTRPGSSSAGPARSTTWPAGCPGRAW